MFIALVLLTQLIDCFSGLCIIIIMYYYYVLLLLCIIIIMYYYYYVLLQSFSTCVHLFLPALALPIVDGHQFSLSTCLAWYLCCEENMSLSSLF